MAILGGMGRWREWENGGFVDFCERWVILVGLNLAWFCFISFFSRAVVLLVAYLLMFLD